MKRILFVVVFLIYGNDCLGQIIFTEGYFITDSDERKVCLIKNVDWKNNPTEFDYKTSADSEVKSKSIETVKEFGINNYSKYRRFIVDIDRSSDIIREMSWERSPKFERDTLFLKVLVEGEATLYVYQEKNNRRYFLQTGESRAQQLVYKKYRRSGSGLGVNDDYKRQLYYNLKCDGQLRADIKSVSYRSNDLVDLLIKYNNCVDSKYVDYSVKGPKSKFHFKVKPGINRSSLVTRDVRSNTRTTDFGSELNFRIGAELEFILPYNRNKWAIIIDPAYQQFRKTVEIPSRNQVSSIKYSSIELPLGARHYFYLDARSKLFINGFVVYDYAIENELRFSRGNDHVLRPNLNYMLGFGYNYDDFLSLEIRGSTGRHIIDNPAFYTNYKTVSLLFGFNFFKVMNPKIF